ncbi:uncharacterized protein RhoGEF3 isoform X1 [Euwallacea fornicatus]|uniref:uncharacterized protein RhoGEF3 isoform X1 n=1 Tax=Euwallacea fornicatus TaxID=995702 RepID=UPI00338DD41D
MSRDDLEHIRDRLMQLADSSSSQRLPFNVKRKTTALSRQTSKTSSTKISMQDFVRMDPGYTPDIEHLVFPNARRRSPQQVAPAVPLVEPPSSGGKTRSRLAEMFALSRHLQRSSADRLDTKQKGQINRSVDSAIEAPNKITPHGRQSSMINDASKKWVYSVDAALRQNSMPKVSSRVSPSSNENQSSTNRGPNVSILHLRSTSEPWDRGPPVPYCSAARSYFASSRSTTTTSSTPSTGPPLMKHQSLGSSTGSNPAYKWSNSPSFHSGSEVNSPGIFTFSGSYNRELSPVRWCDREVDGVYLGKSGWVQVQQRSLDDNRKASYSINLAKSLQSRRTGVKLANYHFYSEPNKFSEYSRTTSVESQSSTEPRIESKLDSRNSVPRPTALQLQQNHTYDRKYKTPSPLPDPGSPPSVTPIISPPPAFQDKTGSPAKSRSFFGKAPFLPRSKAIEDSDNSPPTSPIGGGKWVTTAPNAPLLGKPKTTVIKTSPGIEKPPRAVKKVPQTKSLEDTTASRRMQFKHQYGSSSSSSSSMGFRSLDSCLNRTNSIMPRLLENADSAGDVCGDADEEDNNSSSINMTINLNTNLLQAEVNRKLSPSGRTNRLTHYRNQPRRSPAGSDTKPSPASSSSSSNEFLSRSPPTPQHPTVIRRNAPRSQFPPPKPPQEDPLSRVRRSRSLQLPERQPPTFERVQKLSPQHPEHTVGLKERPQYPLPADRPPFPSASSPSVERSDLHEEELLREAEVVSGYLYGNRSRAAAQALLMHRYNNNNISMEEKSKEANKPALKNELTVYYVGNNRNDRLNRVLLRGATSPSLPSTKSSFENMKDGFDVKGSCSPETCDFWPHCAHRENLCREQNYVMRSSQSYPLHQRSSESLNTTDSGRSVSTVVEKKSQDQFKRRSDMENRNRKPQEFRRISPNRPPATGASMRRNGSTEISVTDRKTSPRSSNVSGSSSGSDAWLSTSRMSSRRGSRASTPVDTFSDKERSILSRPGSAPMHNVPSCEFSSHQQRSMSLPKSFLTSSSVGGGFIACNGVYLQSGQIPWRRQGTESLSSSPGIVRKIPTPEIAHTAPVTPLHEGRRGRSPLGNIRRNRATSTPQLAEHQRESRNWHGTEENSDESLTTSPSEHHNEITPSATSNESVLQKFRKTISLHFTQRKLSKDSCASDDTASETVPSEEESSPQHTGTSSGERYNVDKDSLRECSQKYRFGPLVWHSNKAHKKLDKATRNAKCNSGDSGIQIEIPGTGGGTGDSSESHDTDGPSNDSPIPRRKPPGRLPLRPHSDIVSPALVDKYQADAKPHQIQQPPPNHPHQRRASRQVRRTRSDLGGQRLLGWEQRQAARRLLRNMALSRRPLSPRKRPPDENDEDGLVIRRHVPGAPPRRPALRRSLSQPVDIDKISPLVLLKTSNHSVGPTATMSEDEHDSRMTNVANNVSDEDTMSDSDVSSIASLTGHKKSLELPEPDEDMVILAEAVFDHVSIEPDELPFRAGDVIEVEDTTDREWWWGSNNGRWGWFPAQFVRLRVSQEDTVEDCLAAIASGRPVSTQIRRRTSISLLSNDQVRTSVVRELVHTERDFVKVLRDVSEGYLSECRKRKDMFTEEQIATIFINLEEILHFQVSFLRDLESCIILEAPHKSCLGECFLKHSSGFKMYSDYCNSHPLATAALQDFYQNNKYSKFFEACRLMRGLMEIPLDGYLLTPVQRICKYPLQLAELLKYTRTDHEDYANIREALEVMRGVAMLINERKRVMESLEKLAAWQLRVDGWEGEDLIEMSSQLIKQGEVIRVTTGVWTNNITLFLFDRQVVYCKKDILKRNTYVYKGRICLDSSEIIDVPDGKDPNINVSVRHAIKLLDGAKDKWFVFCCRSAKEKQRWLDAFQEERRLVEQYKDNGLRLPPAARKLAKIAACRQKRPPRKARHGTKITKQESGGYLGSSMVHLNVAASNSHSLIGRKMATWFNFGAGKKSRHRDIP